MVKRCNKCALELPIEEFGKFSRTRDGFANRCKKCTREEQHSKPSNRRRKRWCGAPLEEYERLLEEQNGKCAICGLEPGERRHCVDHCHVTGVIRGVICNACNMGLGYFRDNPEFLEAAAVYLRKIPA